ncbi:MAG: protein kinase [Paludisphaera borealis]|uniref:protein kinase domain-containing protein n=1 Tax=Paludisphaera borealis TaxID=1387353 RepID=UPI0028405B34|nr:protein kinase [Paludisphaera borealis]MDR3620641.1 protein kinase [Paludisphaera borealis]
MTELDIDTLVDQLTLIGLISRDQYREARADAADSSGEAFLRVLMRKGWLTSWQLERLKKGDTGNFFFGNYRTLFHLAEGTFARVYRGERVDTGEPVAIKVLRQRFAQMPDAVRRFQKEAEAGMRLRHENIVLITDAGLHDSRPYMAMEYVEGMNLREFLRLRMRIKGPQALPLMIGLAEGLKYSHEQGVTHRDLKATNILISNSGVAKLVDFGLATIEGDDAKGMHSQRTVDYSALERTCGSPKGDPRSDIYFLGCVFYHMLTGQVALADSESTDPLKKMLKRSFGVIKPISEHSYPPAEGLSRIIERMMKVDVKARYQSMEGVVDDLKHFRDSVAGGGSHAPVGHVEGSLEEALALDPSIFQAPVEAPEPEEEQAAEAKPVALKNILCVEAQSEIQDAMRKTLSRMGYRVMIVADPERAAERYSESPPDALIFDVDGLGPNSLDSLAAMRAKAEEDGLPFLALVLLGPRQDVLKEKLPAAERMIVLSKPLKLRQVQDAIAELLPVASATETSAS